MIARRRARPLRRRGSFLTVMLVALPLMLLGMSLAADYARSIYVSRQLSDTAEAVVMAGATGFSASQPGLLDPNDARSRAVDMYRKAVDSGMLTVPSPRLSSVNMINGNRTIRAELAADVELIIPSALLRLFGRPSLSITATSVRTASVCQPTNPGGCMYPVSP